MRLAPHLLTIALAAIALRAALGQTSPGQRGDPYAPAGPPTQVQVRYPLAQPAAGPPQPQPAPTGAEYRYPLPGNAPPGTLPAQAMQPPISGVSSAQPPPAAEGPASAGELFEPSKIVAVIGNQYIFYGDVAPVVNQIMEPIASKITNKYELAELERMRPAWTRQVVQQMVDTKLMYLDFRREIEKQPKDKLKDIEKDIVKRMSDSFEKELNEMRPKVDAAKPDQIREMMARDPIIPRVAVLMRDRGAETLGELDTILRGYGSSLDKQIRFYGENRLGRSTVGKHLNLNKEVTHLEMLDYYRDHAADFALPAKARFEILSVKFANFPDKSSAYNVIAQMGNEVYFGAPLATIARKHSQEPGAKNGGYYDWTTKGSLASEVIDAAIFALEPGKLSQIIEDPTGYHIVRVVERREAGQVDFIEAQPTIKKAIETQRREAAYKKYISELRTRTTVWTIYDEDEAAVAQQPAAGTAQR
jgi:hypothetical protein